MNNDLIFYQILSTTSNSLRWLNTVFQGQYLPSLSINYVAMNKVLEKLPPQLYQPIADQEWADMSAERYPNDTRSERWSLSTGLNKSQC